MQKKIGKVVLDDTYYKGSDVYSDGSIEDVILQACMERREEELLRSSAQWPILYHLSDVRENILEWYPLQADAQVLEIGSGCGAITGILQRKAKSVDCIDLSMKRSLINAYRHSECDHLRIFVGNFQDIRLEKKYDYITLIGVWEYAGLYVQDEAPYHKMLRMVQGYLKEGGKILVAIENKTGLKYWNGAAEDHTGKMYSGMNDYIGDRNVRTFSKPEIETILEESGIRKYRFYYPMPDYKLPDCVYSASCLPQPGDLRYYRHDYALPRMYPFLDATASDQVCADGMFSYFANSFFFVCGDDGAQQQYVKYSRTRKPQFQIATEIVHADGGREVRKRALCSGAGGHIQAIKEKEKKWVGMLSGLRYVNGRLKSGVYVAPYVEGVNIDQYLYAYRHQYKKMLHDIRTLFARELAPDEKNMEPFVETAQFVEIFGRADDALHDAPCLPATNIDLLFSNLRLTDGGVVNFDYEWVFDFPVPFEYALWRAVNQLYDKYAVYLKPQVSREDFLSGAGISMERACAYETMEKHFAAYVYGEPYMRQYQKHAMSQTVTIS